MARLRTAAPKDTADAFSFEAKLWLAAAPIHQSGTLATRRNTLLPKLLRGELGVAAIYKMEAAR